MVEIRLIDANALKDILPTFAGVIDEQLTIKAVPVQHGQWVQTVFERCYKCSVCNFEQTSNPNQRFCSYCGAKMYRGEIEV